ncbi:WD40 repeat domain-containing protein [Streptomyces sp. NBC_00988]|uniref:WD40 repeat domain-containing protein n=1 Tax=Streptomyces sp. NBC_00988 TaxID=2903704 RepID=UPI00386CFD4F|nr:WD40 repeat domain-containing protein [Streptomyces sp. NBC_00988]
MTSLAENAATGQDRWPGPLEAIRRHAWIVLAAGLVLALFLAVYAVFHEVGSSAAAEDPPPPGPPDIPQWVVDRDQARKVAGELLRRQGRGSVGITAAAGLHGAGGFGKTTLAEMVWADRRVRRRFRGRIYRVTLGLNVRSRAEITAKVTEATRFITGDTTVFDDPDLAGTHLGRLLDARPPMLLLLDDVWSTEQLAPFLIGGANCRRLITTRLPELLPGGTYRVRVDQMSAAQARQVLAFGLSEGLPEDTVLGLLRATGRWPLLLRICNQYVHRRTETGMAASDAAAEILRRLRLDGPASLDPALPVDLNDPRARQTAVVAAVEAGTALLPPGGFERFTELGVFAEDEYIPIVLVTALWQATVSMRPEQSRDLCAALAGLSLLELDPARGGRVRLHDVIRDLLRTRLGDAGAHQVSGALVDAVATELPLAEPQPGDAAGPVHAWWQHPDQYLANHLVTHLLEAGRVRDAEALALDLRWIEQRLAQGGATAPLADLDQIPTTPARQAASDFARTAHLLGPLTPTHALGAVLRSRLAGYDTWRSQASAWRSTKPALHNRWPLPDIPDPAVIWVLAGHTAWVTAVAISPDGTWLATGSIDGTVRIWDRATGRTTATLTGHTESVGAVAISPDGTWLATCGGDGTVRIWDTATGATTGTLGHFGWLGAVAISPDGTWLAAASIDRTVRIWNCLPSHSATATLTGHTGRMGAVAISPDGTWLTTGGGDGTVRIWDTATGATTATLTGHTEFVSAVAISPDGTWLTTGSIDRTVRIWDTATGATTATLTGHTGWVEAVAISPDGTWLATASTDRTVRIWETSSGRAATVMRTESELRALAWMPDGRALAVAGGLGLYVYRFAPGTPPAA